MVYDDLRKLCLMHKGSFEGFPFGADVLVIKVVTKIFAIIVDDEKGLKISLKCEPELAELLRKKYESVIPGYHLNKKHWNTVNITDEIDDNEIIMMISHSYERVFKSLKRSEKDSIK